MKLVSSLVEVILEQVSNSVIKDAVVNKYACELKYLDDEKLPNGS